MIGKSTFRLSQDEIDSLKMEVSELSPEEETLYRKVLITAKRKFEDKYGEYIGKDTIKRNHNIENRVIFVSPETPLQFSNDWLGEDITEQNKHLGGFNTQYGEFSIVENPRKLWESMNPLLKEQFKEIIGADGNWLEKYFVHTERIAMALHELIHSYQDPNLPSYIKECATSYYTEQLLSDLDIIPLTTIPEQEERAKVYAEVINEFGDDAHRVFFNTILSDRQHVRQFIIDSFPKVN